MEGIIDRIEGKYLVVELENGELLDILMPEELKGIAEAGQMIHLDEKGNIEIDFEKTEVIREEQEDYFEDYFEKDE